MPLRFDHIAISALSLEEGVAHVEAALGVALQGGGQHAHMATHNRLLGLGDLYLEVIAADPSAPKPAWPRWFDLDRFTGPPRLTNWILACDDIEAVLAAAPAGAGKPVALARGDYRWQMAVPANGQLPYDGAYPALIQWQGDKHPAQALSDLGIRLTLLEVAHPQAEALRSVLPLQDPRVQILPGPHKALRATFSTPHGTRVIA
ncbi:VOC family protein [Xinfangfangia sp. CPCC 101601]|uniref:VOC family protein n=1 Tax=Pseudogemmobacter lacusdianii TaxID=3069608 RepID=A0ABU0VT89_9RHOB|nr:VOC family protein [Xinfangfangia sp. CPCC 101601]MDQ2064941.1 VOC family protein [Xinfangfangia sp. CPCC 101601]